MSKAAAQEQQPVEPVVEEMPTFRNPISNKLEPLLTQTNSGEWIGPKFVEDMIALRFTYISDAHKKMIQNCVSWNIVALKWAYRNVEIKRKSRRLLGTFQYTQCLSWAQPSWPKLMDGLDKEMGEIGNKLDKVFKELGLRETLGTFEPNMLENTNNRQDCPGGLVVPSYFAQSPGKNNPLWHIEPETIGHEIAYIHFLRLVAVAVTDNYKDYIQEMLKDLILGGTFYAGGIKGYERMQNKLKSFEDHWTGEVPRPAENVDVVRGMAVFDNPQKFREALDILQKNCGPFVKFKNGMAWSDAQAKASMHLRLILASIRFTPKNPDTNANITFGDLCKDPRVQRLWKSYSSHDPPASRCVDEGVVGAGPWHRSIQIALGWLKSDELRNQEVAMVCEVQMLMDDYRNERHKMHEMYKVRRADNAVRLHADFVSSQKKELQEVERKKDQGMHKVGSQFQYQDTQFAKLKRFVFEQSEDVDFEKQIRAKMDDLQQLTLTQCAGLLSIACKYGKLHVVNVLLEMIGQFEDKGAVLTMLGLSGAGYHFPLFNASVCRVSAKRLDIMRALINAKADPKKKTSGGCSSLWKAANSGFLDSVRFLVESKAEINSMQESTTITPLYNACYRGHDEIATLLIEHKGNVNQVRKSTGATPLYTACENAHAPIVNTLIQHKANVNQCTSKNKSSPMYIAAQNGHLEIIHILAGAKCNPHLGRAADGCTALYAAADKGYGAIVEYLHHLIHSDLWSGGSREAVPDENPGGVDVLCQNSQWCPVSIAAYRGFLPCVKVLVALGANQHSISMGIQKAGGKQAAEIKAFLEPHKK